MYLIGVVYICFEIHVGFLKVVYLYPLYLYTELQREIFFGGGVRKEVSKTITLFRGFLHRYSLPYFLTRFLTDFFIYNTQISTENIYRILIKQTGQWPCPLTIVMHIAVLRIVCSKLCDYRSPTNKDNHRRGSSYYILCDPIPW